MSVSIISRRRSARDHLLRLAAKQPVLRASEVLRLGVHPEALRRLTKAGSLERIGVGRYRLPAAGGLSTENHDLAVVAAAVPQAVICLVSALRFHNVGTQLASEVSIAVPRGTRVPRLLSPSIRVVQVSPDLFDSGIEKHRVEGQTVRVYSLARTVADCFRFRNKIGLDVALEALSEAWRSKRIKMDELNRIAKRLRVQRVMQPYIDTVVL
jgi:predicted transcriptional regulator of viral defense system